MPRSSGERKISEKWRGSRKKLVLRWPWEEMMICMGTGETRRHLGKKSHVDEGSETGIGAVWLWDQEGVFTLQAEATKRAPLPVPLFLHQ